MAVLAAAFVGVLLWRRRKRTSKVDLVEDSPQRTGFRAQPYLATHEEYPLAERNGSLGKRHLSRRGRNVPASSDSMRGLVGPSHASEEGTVRVDATVLQRLLLALNLFDPHHRGGRNDSGSTIEPPPGYEEGSRER